MRKDESKICVRKTQSCTKSANPSPFEDGYFKIKSYKPMGLLEYFTSSQYDFLLPEANLD